MEGAWARVEIKYENFFKRKLYFFNDDNFFIGNFCDSTNAKIPIF